MQPVIAKHNLGPCAGCGVNVDAGEWATHHTVGITHAGCIPRQKLDEVGYKKRKTEQSSDKLEPKKEIQSGFLFSDAELATIENAKEVIGVKHVAFDGATVLQIDTPRLAGQLARIFELMSDGKFRTLAQIAGAAGCLETSASARLRDLRKARFGSHAVVSRLVADSPTLYEYRLILNGEKQGDARRSAA